MLAFSGDWQWWLYKDRFYTEGEAHSAEDVQALIEYRETRRERRLQHAHAVKNAGNQPVGRMGISYDVRRAVFKRDEGKCQECGSRELIQFDHIIPVALGGSSEPKNLQLLCTSCNRAKAAEL